MPYLKFCIMLFISFLVMYTVMFLNVDDISHVYISLTRFYMALLMVTPMAVMMIAMMDRMYANKKLNIFISAGSILVFILALTALRTQTPVGDVQYMKAMIPHHSSAILTSKHAHLKDPDVINLSKEIIESQEREIGIMKKKLKELE